MPIHEHLPRTPNANKSSSYCLEIIDAHFLTRAVVKQPNASTLALPLNRLIRPFLPERQHQPFEQRHAAP
jgi:hypothetical protein